MLLERAAALDDAASCYYLSVQDNNIVLFRKAVILGHGSALARVAQACVSATDSGNKTLAAHCYRRLEELPVIWDYDCSSIWVKLGKAYENGESMMPQDARRAAAMFARLADNMQYCHHLGRLLRDGVGVPRDLARAQELFALGSEEDDDINPDAHLLLAYSCMHGGSGVDVDIPRAVDAFKRFFKRASDIEEPVMHQALWDLILVLLRTNHCTEAATWSCKVINRVHTLDLTTLDPISASEALLALLHAERVDGSYDDEREHMKSVLLGSLGLPTSGWEGGEHRAQSGISV